MSSSPTNSQIEDALRESAIAPAKASNETGSVEQHSLKDRIDLDKHLLGKAVVDPFRCIHSKVVEPVPPGRPC